MPCCNPSSAVPACLTDSVRELLRRGGRGEVLMVNSAGVYLSAEEEIVFLCDISWGVVPIGIAAEAFRERIDPLHLQAGQPFTFGDTILRFRGGILRVQPMEFLPGEDVSLQPLPYHIRQAAEDIIALRKANGLSMLAVPLILNRDNPAVLSLNPYCTRAYPRLERLIHALKTGADAEVSLCVQSLLGLGTGLTPSADDILLGMLYAFRRLPQEAPQTVRVFRESIAALCDTHTNRISAAYLRAILRGEPFARMERVWRGLCGREVLVTTALTEIGSNSGSEMLLGMLIALRVCGYDAAVG